MTTNPGTQNKRTRGVSLSVAVKVILLAITPIVLMAALNLYSAEVKKTLFKDTANARAELDKNAVRLDDISIEIKDVMNALTTAISQTGLLHQTSMLNRDVDAVEATTAARGEAVQYLDAFTVTSRKLQEAAQMAGYIPTEEEKKKNPKLTNEIDRRITFLRKASDGLSRAYTNFELANYTTIELIKAEKFDEASSNFVYEESARIQAIRKLLEKMTKVLNGAVKMLHEKQKQERTALTQNAEADLERVTFWNFVVLAISAVVLILVSVLFANFQLASPIRKVAQVMETLADDNTDIDLPEAGRDEIGQMINALGTLTGVVDLGISQRSAIQSVNSGVMMIDVENRVSLVNPALKDMMLSAETDIQKQISSFSAHDMPGMDVDVFGNLSPYLNQDFRDTLNIGVRIFDIVGGPVFNKHGKALGAVIEWKDVTQERKQENQQKAVLQEVQSVVRACAKGDFSSQVSTEGLDGFLLELAEGMNSINEVSYKGLQEINESVNAIAHGDLSKDISGHYEGMFDEIKQAFNNTLVQLGSIISDATATAEQASAGDFTKRINTEGKEGFMLELAKGINAINDVSDRGLTEIRTSLQAIASGDLQQSITGRYDGMFDEIKSAYNNTQKQLLNIIGEATAAAEAAGRGDFTRRIDLMNKDGFMLELASGINMINEISDKGLNEMKSVVDGLSNGDLTQKVTGEYEGMFDEIKQALNNTIDRLVDTTLQIQRASDSVDSAAKEISSGSHDLSQRTEEQASSLQETAASVNLMTETIQNNAANASEADKLASNSRQAAEGGVTVVRDAVEAMARIEQSSAKISDITNVIDEIAFQINLLALNAAVEAARAGEAGKGFEVVAAEVRKLAQRSAGAAKDIAQLLEASDTEVRSGAALVHKTGDSLENIVVSIKSLASTVGEIADASKEQSSGIDQINQTVNQLDSMTQQNASLVEESNASAQSMAEQSKHLTKLISFFKTAGYSTQQDASNVTSFPVREVS